MKTNFWSRLDQLIKSSEIVIDRPKGTAHPKYPDLIFPLDYGYLKDTCGGEGEEVDVWLGSEGHGQLTAIACTVDMKKKDAEIKLLIGCTDEEIAVIEDCHNSPHQSAIIIRRDSD
jgi:inorganic pyrophosphatase